jgi:hypothetical protein
MKATTKFKVGAAGLGLVAVTTGCGTTAAHLIPGGGGAHAGKPPPATANIKPGPCYQVQAAKARSAANNRTLAAKLSTIGNAAQQTLLYGDLLQGAPSMIKQTPEILKALENRNMHDKLIKQLKNATMPAIGFGEINGFVFAVPPNCAQVAPGLFAGSRLEDSRSVAINSAFGGLQPDGNYLKHHGIRAYIDLNAEDIVRNANPDAQYGPTLVLGMVDNNVGMPLKGSPNVEWTPDGTKTVFQFSLDQKDEFLQTRMINGMNAAELTHAHMPPYRFLADAVNFASLHFPTYVHCEAGAGRTHLVVLAYKFVIEGPQTLDQMQKLITTFGTITDEQSTFMMNFAKDYIQFGPTALGFNLSDIQKAQAKTDNFFAPHSSPSPTASTTTSSAATPKKA